MRFLTILILFISLSKVHSQEALPLSVVLDKIQSNYELGYIDEAQKKLLVEFETQRRGITVWEPDDSKMPMSIEDQMVADITGVTPEMGTMSLGSELLKAGKWVLERVFGGQYSSDCESMRQAIIDGYNLRCQIDQELLEGN